MTPLQDSLELCRATARSKAAGCPYLRWLFARFVMMESILRSWAEGNRARENECNWILRNNGYSASCSKIEVLLTTCRGESSGSSGAASHGSTVLLVDDDLTLLRALTRVLKGRFRVLVATNAASALLILQTRRVHVVVSDFEMPGEPNGLDLLQEVHAQFPLVRRILMSARQRPVFQDALAVGLVEHFLLKRNDIAELAAAIEPLVHAESRASR